MNADRKALFYQRIRRVTRVLHPTIILIYVLVFIAVAINGEERSHQEVIAIQIDIETRLSRVENRTVEIASQTNENSNRIDKLEAIGIPAILAEIKTTVQFDHTLMWFIAASCVALMIERVGQLLAPFRKRI